MKKSTLTFIVIIFGILTTNSQELPEIIPPTPDVYSLGKFGEYPVATNYGTVPVSIPLFELKSGDITVPVSISYHSSGIKVNEEASSIGLGWALNAGGTISKSVKGADDRSSERNADVNNTSFLYDGATTLNQYYNIRPTLSFEDGNHEVFLMDDRIAGLEVDGQSDNYFFNFLNRSGKFVFKGGGTDDILIYPVHQNLKFEFKENVRIDNKPGVGYADGFYTVDDKGFEYWFDDQENVLNQNPNGALYKSAASWNLSRIYSRNTNNYVIFDYDDFDYAKWNYSYNNDYDPSNAVSIKPDFMTLSNAPLYFHRLNSSLIEYQTKALKEIRVDNGNGAKLVFEILNDREDINASESFFRYKSISLFDEHNQLIKKVTFHHSYFNAKTTGVQSFVNTVEGRKRLRLDSITIAGKDQVAEQTYTFDYHNEPLPHINSLEKDYWGYYNGRDPDKILPSTPYTNYEGANLNSHPDRILAGSLKRIHYPTGGSTEFEFEANEVLANSTSTPILDHRYKDYNQSGICQNNHNSLYSHQLDVAGVTIASVDVTITFPDIPSNAFDGTHPKDVVDGNFVRIDGAGPRITADGSGYQLTNGVYKHAPIVIENQTFVNQATGDQDLILTHYKYICDNNEANAYGPSISIEYDIHYGGSTEQYYNAPTGGLRINKITNVDENGVAQIKEYNYNYANEDSTGSYAYAGGLPVQFYTDQEYWGGVNPDDAGSRRNVIRVFNHSLYDLGIAGSVVCYGKVTETIKSNLNQPLGRTEYFYKRTQNGNSAALGFPFAPLKDQSHRRALEFKKVYNANNNLVFEESYNNTYAGLGESKQLLIRGLITYSGKDGRFLNEQEIMLWHYNALKDGLIEYGDTSTTPGYAFIDIVLENNYNITNEYLNKIETVTTQYDIAGNNPVTTTSKQFYGSSTLMSQSDVFDSRNGRLRTKYYYPQDIPNANALAVGGAFTTSEYTDIVLLNSDRPSSVVQTENYRSTNPLLEEDDGELLSAQRTIYDSYPYEDVYGNTKHFKLPNIVKTLKGIYDPSDNPLIDRVTYHDYDDKGNPLEVSKVDGTHVVYIWGYNEEYPIAKIENASYDDFTTNQENKITAAVNASDVDSSESTENTLRTKLTDLRNAFPNAMISTYTYDPLVGVTSMTDAKGYTMSYEYDEFNRLEYVKDADGKILSKNEYHYKGQQ